MNAGKWQPRYDALSWKDKIQFRLNPQPFVIEWEQQEADESLPSNVLNGFEDFKQSQ